MRSRHVEEVRLVLIADLLAQAWFEAQAAAVPYTARGQAVAESPEHRASAASGSPSLKARER
jgi:hypothetical protein